MPGADPVNTDSRVSELEQELADYRRIFDARWKADMRAVERWQDSHPGNEMVWPSHEDAVLWLLGRLDDIERVLRARVSACESCDDGMLDSERSPSMYGADAYDGTGVPITDTHDCPDCAWIRALLHEWEAERG